MGYIGAGVTRFNTADELTVTGDAQIDTTTLVVDSTNNRVGVGTASPATALDVTGTVTADGLTVDGSGTFVNFISSSNSAYVRLQNSVATGGYIGYQNAALQLWGNASYKGFQLDGTSNDISFYDSTGVTQGLYWDASSQNLGIGTTSPSQKLSVGGSASGAVALQVTNSTAGTAFNDGMQMFINDTAGGLNMREAYPLQFYVNGSERMRIDSSGNVGIGTSSPSSFNGGANNLVVGTGSGSEGITIYGGNESNIFFADGTAGSDAYIGRIEYSHLQNAMKFYINNSEAARFDSSQNFLLGKTAIGVNNEGIGLRGNFVEIATDGDRCLFLNRQTSDGSIVEFRKDNTAVGSIGADSGDLYVGTGDTGVRFRDAGDDILPFNPSTGADRDAAIDLGDSSSRFKDAHFSGTVNVGGLNVSGSTSGSTKAISANSTATEVWHYVGSNGAMFRAYDDSANFMHISATGNVGIGTTSPVNKLQVNGSISATGTFLDTGSSPALHIGVVSGNPTIASGNNVASTYLPIVFKRETTTGASESMRLDSSGNLLVGDSSVASGSNSTCTISTGGTISTSRAATNTQSHHVFYNPNGSVGSITTNGTSTAYNTSSDYRLKENVTADWDATTRLKQLNPVRFNFIADADTTVDGFLAHEVQSVVPEAITGTKDAVDADGNPVYQGIDQSKLVPLLVKTIQELEARIAALEAN